MAMTRVTYEDETTHRGLRGFSFHFYLKERLKPSYPKPPTLLLNLSTAAHFAMTVFRPLVLPLLALIASHYES